jgi:DHA2 family multidrug resistance protein
MVSHLSPFDPVFQQRLSDLTATIAARGNLIAAPQQAYGEIYQTLVRQATLLAYIDNFRFLAFLCVLCMPAALLFRKVKGRKQAPALH